MLSYPVSRRWAERAGVAAAVVVLAGCGERGRADGARAEAAPALTLVEEWRVGTAAGGRPESFGEIVDLEVDPLGRLLVLDGMAGEVRVFGPSGEHVRTLGRAGEGPGELATPVGMDLGPDGRLWILDARNNRFTVYDTTGALTGDVPRPASGYSRPWLGGFDAEGRLLDATFLPTEGGNRLVLLRMDVGPRGGPPAAIPRDTFELPRAPVDRFTVYETDAAGRRRGVSVAIPFTPGLQRQVTPGGVLWSAFTGEYRLVRQTPEGDTLREVARRHANLPVSPAQLDSALAVLGDRTSPDLAFDADRIPDVWPALDAFFEDEVGRLWVRPIEPGPRGVFDLFDPSGRYLGRLRSNPPLDAVPPPVARGDTVWGAFRDDVGVQRVLRARVVPDPSRPGDPASPR